MLLKTKLILDKHNCEWMVNYECSSHLDLSQVYPLFMFVFVSVFVSICKLFSSTFFRKVQIINIQRRRSPLNLTVQMTFAISWDKNKEEKQIKVYDFAKIKILNCKLFTCKSIKLFILLSVIVCQSPVKIFSTTRSILSQK